jgi:hypothetical protein
MKYLIRIHGVDSFIHFNKSYELLLSRLSLAIELLNTLDNEGIPDNEFDPFRVVPEEWLASIGF